MPNSLSPVWPGPSLLVPLTVDVLLIGNIDVQQQSTWADTHTSYYNLWKGYVPDAAAPFSTKACPAAGAHLMWTLPFSLRQGNQVTEGDDAGALDFPLVPNRWVVTRVDYSQSPPALTAWVVQSDALAALQDAQQTGQFPNPSGNTAQPVMVIGQSVPLASWTGPAGPTPPFLQAVGPGDVSWAAEFDNVGNVFTFYDPLFTDAAQLTYTVAGWYADPGTDPLQALPVDSGDNWRAMLEQSFNWSVGDGAQDVADAQAAWTAWAASRGLTGPADPSLPPQMLSAIQAWQAWQQANGLAATGATLPQAMVCHGMAATVQWNGTDFGYGTGVPGGDGSIASVAVGSTATEAIAAYMAAQVIDEFGGTQEDAYTVERALEAFQQGLLFDLASDPVGTEFKLQQARFGSAAGGTEWIVVRPDDDTGSQVPAYGGQQTIPLTPEQTEALSALNALQRAADATSASLASQRAELFALWFKQKVFPRGGDPAVLTQVNTAMTAVQGAVTQSLSTLSAQQAQLQADAGALRALLGSDYVLRDVDLPPYYGPNDPVIMIGGAQLDPKLSPPGTYDEDATLFTRVTGQTITSITVTAQWGTATLGAAELLGSVQLPVGVPIPKETPDLWVEALLLDTGAAPLLASLYFQALGNPSHTDADLATVAAAIAAQQGTAWNDSLVLGVTPEVLQGVAGLAGVLPSPVGVEFRAGQPWTPIFMDWSVTWIPTSFTPSEALQQWQLGEIDYEWQPPFSVTQPADPVPITGRTVVNPKVAQSIAAQFATFQNDPNYQELPQYLLQDLQHVADLVGDLDLLTQSLSGFTDQLVTRLTAMNLVPTDPTVATLLDGAPVSFRPVTGTLGPEAAGGYFPLRSGHLQINDVWVVDSFGQVLRGKDPRFGTKPLPTPYRAESVVTPDPAGSPGTNDPYVQLPPRVSQPVRAELRFLQADDDAVFSNSSDLTTPLCGWVMPNHLDDSLMVFDAAGNALGAVLPVQRDPDTGASTGLLWEAVPGSDAPLGAAPVLVSAATPGASANPHLQGFVNALLAQGATSSGALTALLDAIDASLWTIDPFGTGTGNLTVLLGRPLAVVRAQVSLSLLGLPAYDQAWAATGEYYVSNTGSFAPQPTPAQSVPFTVRVGDLGYTQNGVLGYFASDDYDTFYAVYGAGTQTSGLRQALRANPPGPELRQALARAAASPRAATETGSEYVQRGHLVPLSADGSSVLLTLLVDPGGVVPIVPGSHPAVQVALAPGPVSAALANMQANFRVGPVLVDPARVRMPLPAEITGNWAYVARTDVTTWAAPQTMDSQPPTAQLADTPPTLAEGWLTLSGALGATP